MVEMRSVNFATGYIYIYIYEEEEMVVGRGGGGTGLAGHVIFSFFACVDSRSH